MYKVGDKIHSYTVVSTLGGFGGQTLRLRCDCGRERCVTVIAGSKKAIVGKCECLTEGRNAKPAKATRATYKVGERHGKLTLIHLLSDAIRTGYKGHGARAVWRCDCGNEVSYACNYVRCHMGKGAACPQCRANTRRRAEREGFSARVRTVAAETRVRSLKGGAKPLERASTVTSDMRDGGLALTAARIKTVWATLPPGKMCPAWQNAGAFVEWSLSHGFARGKMLIRLNSGGLYHPSNCKWVGD